MTVMYEVTYQIDGEERTDRVDAPDAAGAAAAVRAAHGQPSERFELLLVHLVDDEATASSPLVDDGLAVGT
jgi:hypothetical protein